MASSALNSTYKYAILALEASYLTSAATAGDEDIDITGNYVTQTPFEVGGIYTIMDNSGLTTPNCETVMVTDISGLTAVAKTGINAGYTVSGTLGVLGLLSGTLGYSGGLKNSYAITSNAKILTPGVMAAIVAEDFNCRFKTFQDNPKVEFDDESSRFVSGDEGRDIAIAGSSTAELSWAHKMSWGGGYSTLPTWSKIMEATGHKVNIYTTKGIGFSPNKVANAITATIWVFNPDTNVDVSSSSCTVYRYSGAHGGNGCSIGCSKIGDVYMMNMKMSAKFVDTVQVAYTSYVTITSPDTEVPEVFVSNSCYVPAAIGLGMNVGAYADVAAMLAVFTLSVGSIFYITSTKDMTDGALTTAKTSQLEIGDSFVVGTNNTVKYNGRTRKTEISSWSLDFGGIINAKYDQSESTGIAYYTTTDRDPKITINPYMVNKMNDDLWKSITMQMTGRLYIKTSNTHLSLDVPRAQLMSPAISSREGLLNTNRTYRCLRNSNGSTTSYSSLPAWAMYEILIGVRS